MKKSISVTLSPKVAPVFQRSFLIANSPNNQKLKARILKQEKLVLKLESSVVYLAVFGENQRHQVFQEFRATERILEQFPKDEFGELSLKCQKKMYPDFWQEYVEIKKRSLEYDKLAKMIKQLEVKAASFLVKSKNIDPKILKQISAPHLLFRMLRSR